MVGGEKHERPRKKGRDFIYLCAVRSQRRARGDARLAHLFHDAFGSRDGAPWQRSPRSPTARAKPHAHNLRSYRHIGHIQEVYLSPMCFTVGPWTPSVFLCSMLSTTTSGRSSHLDVVDVATVPPSTRASQHAIDLHGQLGSHDTPL